MPQDLVGVAKGWDAQALQAAARRERNGRVRARMLAMLHLARGHTVAQTARRYGLGKSMLYGWIRRHHDDDLGRRRACATGL